MMANRRRARSSPRKGRASLRREYARSCAETSCSRPNATVSLPRRCRAGRPKSLMQVVEQCDLLHSSSALASCECRCARRED